MLVSRLLFTFLFFLCAVLSKKAEEKNSISFLVAIGIILSLFSGFRGYSVGIDTRNYVRLFELISSEQGKYAYGLEPQFKEICYLLSRIYNHPTILLLLCSIVTNFFVLCRIWDFRKESSTVCMVLCYYVSFYFFSMNIMRQMCAVAILFYGTRYIQKRDYVRFLIFILFAFLFHQSALIGLSFLGVEVLMWKYLTKKQKALIRFSIFLLPFAFSFVYGKMLKYAHYFSYISGDGFGFILPIKLIFFFVSFIDTNKKRTEANGSVDVYEIQCLKVYYLVGILLTMLGYMFKYMERVGFPFYIFEGVYWGYLIKSTYNRRIYKYFVVFLLIFSVAEILVSDGQGVFPYNFIFSEL